MVQGRWVCHRTKAAWYKAAGSVIGPAQHGPLNAELPTAVLLGAGLSDPTYKAIMQLGLSPRLTKRELGSRQPHAVHRCCLCASSTRKGTHFSRGSTRASTRCTGRGTAANGPHAARGQRYRGCKQEEGSNVQLFVIPVTYQTYQTCVRCMVLGVPHP
jgi:hypothetical protein